MDINFDELSSKVEAVKIAMTQDKNGYVLKLAINPADAPEDLLRDAVGTRYLAVLVRLSDNDEPVASPDTEEGKKAVAIAGTLCGDENFQEWLSITGQIDELTESAATVWLRKRLKITSRKELKTDRDARKRLADVRAEFMEYFRHRNR